VTEPSAQGLFYFKEPVEAIMEIQELEIIQLELKYCERCGALWMRILGSQDVYCPACVAPMLELPGVRRRKTGVRLPVNDKAEINSQPGGLVLVCGEGGNA
jgi:hypothetical protein